MDLSHFLYRQSQKLKYHFSSDEITKRIAEINRFELKVDVDRDSYSIRKLNLILPKGLFDFIFASNTFDLFISNAETLAGHYHVHENDLCFKFKGIEVYITSGSELFIIREIFIDRCYHYVLAEDTKAIVVDVGMNVGLASLYFALRPDVDKVYSFEPFCPTFNSGLKNFRLNRLISNKIFPECFGLGMQSEIRQVKYQFKNKGINASLVESDRIDSSHLESIALEPAVTIITNICGKHAEQQVVIKIDTEGAEYSIFESLIQIPLPLNIKVIMVEWHKKGPEIIEKFLVKQGFKLMSLSLTKNTGIIYAFR
jgi:FkbM family methyltransferase